MADETYSYFYRLDFFDPNLNPTKGTIVDDNLGSASCSEDIDDDSYAKDEGITVVLFNGSYNSSYSGYSYHGYPIINLGNSGSYYLATNDVIPSPTPINGIEASDPLIVCFLPGTLIATPAGPVPIESLRIGDPVITQTPTGTAATGRIKFLFNQRIQLHAFLDKDATLPIRITVGALGQDQPSRDLFVSPDHALLVDGCLVHAAALINRRTIVQLTGWEGELVYYHIETEHHDLILAEGTPAETFIDNVSRERFDNHAEYQALYPEASPMVESELPRVKYARQLPMAIRRRLEAVADALLGREQAAA